MEEYNYDIKKIEDALQKAKTEYQQLEIRTLDEDVLRDTKKQKEIRQEMDGVKKRISTLNGLLLGAGTNKVSLPATNIIKSYNWDDFPNAKEEKVQYTYEPFTKDLNVNQWVIEIHKNITHEGYEKFKELEQSLYRLKEKKLAFYALLHYLGDNNDLYCLVLYNTKFQNKYGFSRSAYTDAMNAMFYYGIIIPTYRKKLNKELDISCRVFIFNANLDPKTLPKEPFCPTNKKHIEIVREIKRNYGMRVTE